MQAGARSIALAYSRGNDSPMLLNAIPACSLGARERLPMTPPASRSLASRHGRRLVRMAHSVRGGEARSIVGGEGEQDLSACAPRAGGPWDFKRRWVVFSDLHASRKSSKTALSVLQTVREAAINRGAGVVFLGDFWHERGPLDAGLLEKVLKELSTWTTPMLMLPGNHDQISRNGKRHTLGVLRWVAPDRIHVFDSPTRWRDALWLPYRADTGSLHGAIDAADEDMRYLRAIFGHADVQGGFVNRRSQMRDGLPPSVFPSGRPVYLGHYHRPHCVPNTNGLVRYVGSTYEVTHAEEGQQKALLVLDDEWRVIEEIPVNLGPRHFSLTAWELADTSTEPCGISPKTFGADESGRNYTSLSASSDPAFPAPKPGDVANVVAALRPGDRVVLTATKDEERAAGTALESLRVRGVSVRVRQPPHIAQSMSPRIHHVESLDPLDLFAQFAERRSMSSAAQLAGIDIIKTVMTRDQNGIEISGSPQKLPRRHTRLDFESVSATGYFTFRDTVEWPLRNRGIVVVIGRVAPLGLADDASIVDSNGAGKSALVHAALWALTGNTGERGQNGLTGSAVINHSAESATVIVRGRLNGDEFEVERTVSRKKGRNRLRLTIAGKETENLDTRATQHLIDELFSTNLLGKVVFVGSNIASLLEATDRVLKEELLALAEAPAWEEAYRIGKKSVVAAQDACRSSTAAVEVLRRYSEKARSALVRADESARRWQEQHAKLVSETEARGVAVQNELAAQRDRTLAIMNGPASGRESSTGQDANHDSTEWATLALGADCRARAGNAEEMQVGERASLQELRASSRRAHLAAESTRIEREAARSTVAIAKARLQEYTLAMERATTDLDVPFTCDRCLQPLDSDRVVGVMEGLKADIAIEEAKERAATIASAEMGASAAVAARILDDQEHLTALAQEAALRQARSQAASAQIAALTLTAKDACEEAAVRFRHLRQLTGRAAAPSMAVLTGEGSLQDALPELMVAIRKSDSVEQELRNSGNIENPSTREVEAARLAQEDADEELNATRASVSALAESEHIAREVSEAFSPSGVLSYAVEGILMELDREANVCLAEFAPHLSLILRPTRPRAGVVSGSVAERILKEVEVLDEITGERATRSMSQLSSGERCRVAAALMLGFRALAERRGHLECNVLVLDEVTQHLDASGCDSLVDALAGTSLGPGADGTVLIVSQPGTRIADKATAVDVVLKVDGRSTVTFDG